MYVLQISVISMFSALDAFVLGCILPPFADLDASMKLAIAAAIMGGVLYFGYFIIRTLVPTSASPMTIRNDALAILQADPDLSSAFGEITRARGIDSGRGEGRRNYVPSYSYERSGKTFTRIKFQVDNASKRSATVFAEVAHDRSTSTDFNYLMVQMDRSKQVLTLVDNRKPEKSRDMRQYDVAVKLQHDGATFYSGGPLHDSTSEQMQILGPHMDYINTVRCDLNEGRCEADGYSAGTLVYRTKAHKAPLGLDDLEGMVGLDRYTRGNT